MANSDFLNSPYAEIQGADVSVYDDPNKGHNIANFKDVIMNMREGNYVVVNGKIVKLTN